MKHLIELLKQNVLGSGLMFVWATFAFLSTAFFIALWIKVIQLFLSWL